MSAFEDDAAKAVPKFIQMYRPNYPVGWNDRAEVLTYMDVWIMTPGYVPKMVFIDKWGRIQAQYEGQDAFFREEEKNIRAELDKVLTAAPPAKAKAKAKAAAGKSKKTKK